MYKQRRKVFQATMFLWITYFTAIFSIVYPAIQDVVVDVCFGKSEDLLGGYNDKAEIHSHIIPYYRFFDLSKFPNVTERFEIPKDQEIFDLLKEQSLLEEDKLQETTETLPVETEQQEMLPVSTIDSRLPGVVYLHIDMETPEAPIILVEERISEEDVLVDISSTMDSNKAYSASPELELCIGKVIYREAGDQPFLGMLLVGEGLVSRIASGVYGNDIPAILERGGYGAEMDSAGVYHVYHSDGKEVINIPEESMAAARIALSGSTLSYSILEAATGIRNQQYGLDFGEECYRYGCIYHYAPDLVSEKELNKRTINTVPVSFRYVDHVLYGYWINSKYALNIV